MHKLIKKFQLGGMQIAYDKLRQQGYTNLRTDGSLADESKFKNIVGKIGQGTTKIGGKVGKFGINAFSSTYDFIPTADEDINATDQEIEQVRGKISQGLMQSGNPWLMAAGAAYGVMDKTGGFTDASEGLGGENDFWNGAASILVPGAGYFADKTEDYKMSGALASSSGYAGTRQSAQKAMKNAGAKLLFGRSKANDMIREAKRQDQLVQGILSDAQTDFAAQNNMAEINGLRIQNVTSGGNQMMRAARRGMRVLTQDEVIKKVEEIKKNRKGSTIDFKPVDKKEETEPKEESQTTIKFQNGGQMNVIPEGALHARLHHMEDENPDLKGQITKKGIPVVSEEEGGEITQQAEIEREEIIFNKETTTALEELYEKYKEDPKPEYAIYAGQILAQQIMENTDDRTGLIDRVV